MDNNSVYSNVYYARGLVSDEISLSQREYEMERLDCDTSWLKSTLTDTAKKETDIIKTSLKGIRTQYGGGL